MRRARTRQRGVALIVLLVILVLGATWFMVTRVARLSLTHAASERERNAVVLKRAKEALIGYVASQASEIGEANPGRFPCPEAAGYIGGASEGQASGSCTLPAVGRLPWRTLGLDKLVDAHGEPLWYVVSPGWAITSGLLTINSNTLGQLTVDGKANAAVALIIAPGTPINAQASSGCGARNQLARGAPSATINPLDYIECFDTATSSFSTTGPATSFNDQVVAVTVADVMPGIEAAISDRIERQIVPELKTVYAAPSWGLSGSAVVYPFAAPFSDPSTSAMEGSAGSYRGLLPVNYSETSPGSGVPCTPGATAPRCAPTFVGWTGTPTLSGASVYGTNCTGTTAAQISCTFYYRCFLIACANPTSVPFTLNATASNVGMALRQLNPNTAMTNVDTVGRSVSAILNTNGSANVTLNGNAVGTGGGSLVSNALCGITGLLGLVLGCKQGSLTVSVYLFADHPLVDSNDPTYGWFTRNKWQELLYYAVATNYSPAGAPSPSCTNGTTCLTVANVAPSGKQRAILILGGRSLNGSARPSGNLADYLEYGNVTGNWEQQPVTAVPASLYQDTGAPNAYALPVSALSAGASLQFRALNANTGAATLTTPATGTKSIVDTSLNPLAASRIQASAAVQVMYDGSEFILGKWPFNDRVIVVDSNP